MTMINPETMIITAAIIPPIIPPVLPPGSVPSLITKQNELGMVTYTYKRTFQYTYRWEVMRVW